MRYKGKWYDSPVDEVRGRWMSAPYENVFIGCDPNDGMTRKTVEGFDAFVNVSCSPCETLTPYPDKPIQLLWHPINECGYWGLSPFYWTNHVLDQLISEGKKIYHHCHAGAHRSPITFYVYLLYKGYSMSDANKIMWGEKSSIDERTMLFRDILDGHISPFLFSFLEAQRREVARNENADEPVHNYSSLMGCLFVARREFEWDKFYADAPKPDPEVISRNTSPRFLREVEAPFTDLRTQNDEYKAWCTKIMRPWLTDDDMEHWTDGEKEGEQIFFASQQHVSVTNDDYHKEPKFTEDEPKKE